MESTEWGQLAGTALGGLIVAVTGAVAWVRNKRVADARAQSDIDVHSSGSEIYQMLREQISELRKELRMVKRQCVVLEKLAMKAGIDIEQAYKDAGLYGDEEPEAA